MWCLWLGNTRGDYYADGSGSTIRICLLRNCGACAFLPWAEAHRMR